MVSTGINWPIKCISFQFSSSLISVVWTISYASITADAALNCQSICVHYVFTCEHEARIRKGTQRKLNFYCLLLYHCMFLTPLFCLIIAILSDEAQRGGRGG